MPRNHLIEYIADGFRINGPKVDGTWTVSYSVGEYEANKLKPHLDLPSQTILKVSVEVAE